MASWPKKPFIYEINTWVWLDSLSRASGQSITLGNVPDDTLDQLAVLGLDAIWLMGIWQRSPFSAKHARHYKNEYKHALPDVTDEDIIGSAYAIHAYEVDEQIGGRSGLAALRQRLQERGLRLILDFVPNHVAVDHAWVRTYPSYIVQGTKRDLKKRPTDFFPAQDSHGKEYVAAYGRDPNFPGWADTAQLNAFNPDLRKAALATLLDIASQCDGVRCDMAMLLLNDIFANTWQGYLDSAHPPRQDFWPQLIPQVKRRHPDFLFMAEVYWGLEYRLQQQGFDLTYDKLLYDRILEGVPQIIHQHLLADWDFQRHSLRFTENHDESCAISAIGDEKNRPAAVLAFTLPGGTLVHDGQLSGRRIRLPVQLRRKPYEPEDQELLMFYRRLLSETREPLYQRGEWRLFDVNPTYPDHHSNANLLAYGWYDRRDEEYRLVVINLTGTRSQGLVKLAAWSEITGRGWRLDDMLNGASYFRTGFSMVNPGLYIDLPAYDAHIFRFTRLT